MRIIILFCIFTLSISCICFAQSDQSESLTITTYYPSPYGVYKTIRLYPSEQPSDSLAQPGVMYFNNTTNTTYIHNDSVWEIFGAGGGGIRAVKVDSGDKVYPENCSGVYREPPGFTARSVPGDTTPYQICSVVWYKNVTFKKAFSKPPEVFVQTQLASGRPGHEWINYTCARHSTDLNKAFATNVTTVGFQLWSSGSPPFCYDCSNCPGMSEDPNITESFVKAEASWMAVGE
ncbi:MAG: H-type lectin domain-containing protein [Candidatus Omnitrophica bacterium]|nr:H-type lectin domain-containing protein [Candidatus Omnitrophota bacterium]